MAAKLVHTVKPTGRKWYLDWCPYATPVIRPLTFEAKSFSDFSQIQEHFSAGRHLPEDVADKHVAQKHLSKHLETLLHIAPVVTDLAFAFRSDGIFMFTFTTRLSEEDKRERERLDHTVCLLAHLIKSDMAHTHVYHAISVTHQTNHPTAFLRRVPVRIPDFTDQGEVRDVLSQFYSENLLSDLKSPIRECLKKIKHSINDVPRILEALLSEDRILAVIPSRRDMKKGFFRPALLKIRVKFSQHFDDLYKTLARIREKMIVRHYTTIIFSAIVLSLVGSWFSYKLFEKPGQFWEYLIGVMFTEFVFGIIYTLVWYKYRKTTEGTNYRNWMARGGPSQRFWQWVLRSRVSPMLIVTAYAGVAFLPALNLVQGFFPVIKAIRELLQTNLAVTQLRFLPIPSWQEMELALADNTIYVGFVLLFTGYCAAAGTEWGMKRRRMRAGLRNTAGSLKFGNIYTRVIERLYLNSTVCAMPSSCLLETGGFSDAISIVEECLRVENAKRPFRIFAYVSAAIVLVGLFFGVLLHHGVIKFGTQTQAAAQQQAQAPKLQDLAQK